jgi:hypothetical protein
MRTISTGPDVLATTARSTTSAGRPHSAQATISSWYGTELGIMTRLHA